jgi:hypothetical protein
MSADLFRTVVPVIPSEIKISFNTSSLLMGSCFTENIGEKLSWYKFPVYVNPLGITYNPVSVKKGLERLLECNHYKKDELGFDGNLYFSFDHHSRFSDVNADVCLDKINTSLQKGSSALKGASFLFLTFGTSWFYRLRSSDAIVNNCHKLPERAFERARLSVDDIIKEYETLIPLLNEYNPRLQLVFTVSPIRHWKDGAHENQLSKSVLLLAIDALCKKFKQTFYFPAYELVMDELRDYRFYEEDMLHPNKIAINFIWQRFLDCFADKDALKLMPEIEKIQLSKQHRPFNQHTDQFKTFVRRQMQKIEELTRKYDVIDMNEEYEYFKKYLL